MKPKLNPASQSAQGQLFDAGPALVDFIDTKNSRVRLADSIQWEIFEDHWRGLYSAIGGPVPAPADAWLDCDAIAYGIPVGRAAD